MSQTLNSTIVFALPCRVSGFADRRELSRCLYVEWSDLHIRRSGLFLCTCLLSRCGLCDRSGLDRLRRLALTLTLRIQKIVQLLDRRTGQDELFVIDDVVDVEAKAVDDLRLLDVA